MKAVARFSAIVLLAAWSTAAAADQPRWNIITLLADDQAEIRGELETRLRTWQESIDDPALALEETYRKHRQRALDRWSEDR